ncbi:hypothetical protein Vafri_14990 [Volvox africanus]|uniref:Cyclin-like domain-containing protein n=2 Tax=Volvox africanus TaxID=51714 RepID=A0A8J4BFQ6_9CHLO|nr:hypothetical protein Vafri_14990 [Volvox africanus]
MSSTEHIQKRSFGSSINNLPCSFYVPPYARSLGELHKGSSQPIQLSPSDLNEHNSLACDEDSSSLEQFHELVDGDQQGTSTSAVVNRAFDAADVRDVIRNELVRLHELHFVAERPEAQYFALEYRSQVVSWFVQVVSALQLAKETLHCAVSLLDRYIAGTKALPTPAVIQLLALSCLSAAAKHEEVAQRSADEWVCLALSDDNRKLYEDRDLHRMEWLLLETVEWRIRVPNTFTFLRHYQAVLTNRGVIPDELASAALFKACSEFMAEISMLYAELLSFGYSTVAVACLILAESHWPFVPSGGSLPAAVTASPVQSQQRLLAAEGPAAQSFLSELTAFTELDASCVAPGLGRCLEFMSHLYHFVVFANPTDGGLALLAPILARYPQVVSHLG